MKAKAELKLEKNHLNHQNDRHHVRSFYQYNIKKAIMIIPVVKTAFPLELAKHTIQRP